MKRRMGKDDSDQSNESSRGDHKPLLRNSFLNSHEDVLINHMNDNAQWSTEYDSPPILERNFFWISGFFLYCLAYVWPPGILVIFYFLSRFIPYAFRTNDDATERRKLFQKFLRYNKHPDTFQNTNDYVNFEEKYWQNDRGMLLYTSIMTPKDKPILSVAFCCHGYTDHSSFSKRIEYQRLVHAGIAVVMIEYEGHGRSDGPLGLIPSWDQMVADVCAFFKDTISSNQAFQNKKCFLVGESMGGAICFCTYNKDPELYHGVVFISPMCKIKEEMMPPKFVVNSLERITGPTGTASRVGYLPITPAKNLAQISIHYPEKGQIIRASPTVFSNRKPRLATAREMLRATKHVSSNLEHFTAPFLVLHGKADQVTDPVLSQLLYDESKSKDKSIKLYDGFWHNITSGESNEDIDTVFDDIIQWISSRS